MKQTKEKKTYEKPAVIYTQVMETVAGVCDTEFPGNGKTGNDSQCSQVNS
jgi:hypothetical protein